MLTHLPSLSRREILFFSYKTRNRIVDPGLLGSALASGSRLECVLGLAVGYPVGGSVGRRRQHLCYVSPEEKDSLL